MAHKAHTKVISGDTQAARLTDLYKKAEKEIVERLLKMYAAGKSGTATAAQLKRQQKQIDDIISNLRTESGELAGEYIKTAYGGGVKVAEADLKANGVSILAKMSGINTKVMKAYASQISSRLADVLTTAGRTTKDIYKMAQLDSSLTGALSGYEAIGQTERKILKRLQDDKGITSFVDNSGKKWNMATYVDMLTRTTTMQMHNEAKKVEFMAHGEDLVQVTYHTPCCEMCAPFNGVVLSLTGNTPGYKTLDDAKAAGLFHPNCRHTYALFQEGIDDEDEAKPDWGEDQDKMDDTREHLADGELTADVIKNDFAKAGIKVSDKYAEQVRQDIYDYTTSKDGYSAMRAAQRENDTESEYYQKAQRIEDWLKVAPVYPTNRSLYRGLSGEGAYKTFDSLSAGDVYREEALTSTSSKLSVAHKFSQKEDIHYPVVIVIQGGMPYCSSVSGGSNVPKELEVLMGKKMKFNVIRKEKIKLRKTDTTKTLVLVVKYKK